MIGRRIAAITLIFFAASVGWFILAGVLDDRTRQAASDQQSDLGSLWGPQETQSAPTFSFNSGKASSPRETLLPIAASEVRVDLQLDARRKGLLW